MSVVYARGDCPHEGHQNSSVTSKRKHVPLDTKNTKGVSEKLVIAKPQSFVEHQVTLMLLGVGCEFCKKHCQPLLNKQIDTNWPDYI